MQQPHHGCIGHVRALNQSRQVDIAFGQLFAQLFGNRADFVGAAEDGVEGGKQVCLAHHCDADGALQYAGDFVLGEQVGGIGHADKVFAVAFIQNDGTKTPRQGFGQTAHQFGTELKVTQIDMRYVELP